MKRILFILFSVCITFLACSSAKMAASSTVRQGITGLITEVTGNQMPMKGAPPVVPKGIQTTVLVYEPTNSTQVKKAANADNYTSIATKWVASVETDSAGQFTLSLPVGSYSLFIKRGKEYYANLFDQANNIALFSVEAGKLTKVKLTVNSSATY